MNRVDIFQAIVLVIYTTVAAASKPCLQLNLGGESIVCLCNSSYCDTLDPIEAPPRGNYFIYSSSLAGDRFTLRQYNILPAPPTSTEVFDVNVSDSKQTIVGFGGAFTDAAGINIMSLSSKTRDNLLQSYYSKQGIEYSVGRIPIGSCDFSTHAYSYDDNPGDLSLSKFALATEDVKYKIPLIQQAQKLRGSNLTLFGSPWSAPAWMKTNNNMTGKGSLKGKPGVTQSAEESDFCIWVSHALDLCKKLKKLLGILNRFLQEYEKKGIKVWGLTAQNEPTDGNINSFPFQAMGWTPSMQGDFIAKDLGPALEQAGYGHIKLMIIDDARFLLPYWTEIIFSNRNATQYISGIAVHWYEDFITPNDALSWTHNKFPDKFILATEACTGALPLEKKVELGSWYRAESYARDIIEDLNNWVVGWTDWNIALNLEGGPNWVQNFVDSPIIVNATKDCFYKQPMFYSLGHFSKFVTPGSKRIAFKGETKNKMVSVVAFIRPDGIKVFIILNRSQAEGELSLKDSSVGYMSVRYPARSIHTVLWQN